MKRLLTYLVLLSQIIHAKAIWTIKITPGAPNFGLPNYCLITAVATGSTSRITVDSSSACGLLASPVSPFTTYNDSTRPKVWIGQTIMSDGLRMPIISHQNDASDTNNIVRTLRAVTGQPNQWDVYTADNSTPVASTTAWSHGGAVLTVEQRTLLGHPRGIVPGPSSSLYANLSNTTSTGHYNASRALRTTLDSVVNTYIGSYGSSYGADPLMFKTNACGARWHAMGKGANTTKDCMVWGLQNITQYFPSTAVGGAYNEGHPNSGHKDYRFELFFDNLFHTYEWGREALSAPEIANYAGWVLNDKPWMQGGWDYTAASHAIPQWIVSTGKVDFTLGGTTVLCHIGGGNVCDFSGLSAGKIVYLPANNVHNFGGAYVVATATGNVSFTVGHAIAESGSNVDWDALEPWVAGKTGLLHMNKHEAYSSGGKNDLLHGDTLSSYNDTYPAPDVAGMPGGGSGTESTYSEYNHQNMVMAYYIAAGLSLVDDDPRAEMVYLDSICNWYTLNQRIHMMAHTPINANGDGYTWGRNPYGYAFIYGTLKNSFTTDYELIPDEFWAQIARLSLGAKVANNHSTSNTGWGFQHNNGWYNGYGKAQELVSGPGWLIAAQPSLASDSGTWAANIRWWLANHLSEFYSAQPGIFTNPSLGNGDSQLVKAFVQDDPSITPVAPGNTSYSLMSTMVDVVDAVFGSSRGSGSTEYNPRYHFFSRSGTGYLDSNIAIDYNTLVFADQVNQGSGAIGAVSIARGNTVLMAGSSDTLFGEGENSGALSIGGFGNLPVPFNTGRTAVLREHFTSQLFATTVNLTNYWAAGAQANSVIETALHMKGGGSGQDILIVRIKGATAASKAWVKRHQFFTAGLSGCPTACAGGVIAYTPGASSGNVIFRPSATSSLVLWTSGGAFDTQGGTNNGTYSGSTGNTWRGAQSETGTSIDWVNVYRPALTNTETFAQPGITTVSTTWKKVEAVLASGTGFVGMVGDGTDQTGVSYTTSGYAGTRQHSVVGLTPGVKQMTSNGVAVTGCEAVTITERSNTMDCMGVAAGNIVVADVVTPVITNSSPLPAGLVGTVYSQTFVATSGTGPYTWTCPGCALPPGVTLASGGVFSGTPTLAGTYNFTVVATDSLGAPGSKAMQVAMSDPVSVTGRSVVKTGSAKGVGLIR